MTDNTANKNPLGQPGGFCFGWWWWLSCSAKVGNLEGRYLFFAAGIVPTGNGYLSLCHMPFMTFVDDGISHHGNVVIGHTKHAIDGAHFSSG